jgi:hypothetical protein
MALVAGGSLDGLGTVGRLGHHGDPVCCLEEAGHRQCAEAPARQRPGRRQTAKMPQGIREPARAAGSTGYSYGP